MMNSKTFGLRLPDTPGIIWVAPGQSLIVGRGPAGVDVQLPYLAVSRRHFRLTNDGRCLIVEDLFSRGGTYVNGMHIGGSQSRETAPGDCIEICGLRLAVENEPAQPSKDIGQLD